jgi:hypothetical protein
VADRIAEDVIYAALRDLDDPGKQAAEWFACGFEQAPGLDAVGALLTVADGATAVALTGWLQMPLPWWCIPMHTRSCGTTRRRGRLRWPHGGRLKWLHLPSVVVVVDVA